MPAKFDIILPTLVMRSPTEGVCMRSIREHSDDNYRLIWIENDAPEPQDQGCCNDANTTHVQLMENIGYTKAINAGLALSTAPYVVLMNGDTEVMTEGWLEKMALCFENHPALRGVEKIAAVGPATDRSEQGDAGRLPKNTGPWLVLPEMTAHGILGVKLWFWCIMLKREAILDVGYLDERFSPGGGDDDDWLTRMYARGWNAAIQTDVLVKHVGQASWPNLEPLDQRSERAHRLLREKYDFSLPQLR